MINWCFCKFFLLYNKLLVSLVFWLGVLFLGVEFVKVFVINWLLLILIKCFGFVFMKFWFLLLLIENI